MLSIYITSEFFAGIIQQKLAKNGYKQKLRHVKLRTCEYYWLETDCPEHIVTNMLESAADDFPKRAAEELVWKIPPTVPSFP